MISCRDEHSVATQTPPELPNEPRTFFIGRASLECGDVPFDLMLLSNRDLAPLLFAIAVAGGDLLPQGLPRAAVPLRGQRRLATDVDE